MPESAVIRDEGGHTRRIGSAGLAIVEDMARHGCSMTTIARRLRMHRDTLAQIRRRQPEVEEALERGYSAMEDELVDILMTRARDPSHKGGVTAAIFLLKARRGYEGTKTPSHITINNDNRQQTLVVPAAQDMDEYMRRVAGHGQDQSVPAVGSSGT